MQIIVTIPLVIEEQLKTIGRLTGDDRTPALLADDYCQVQLTQKGATIVAQNYQRVMRGLTAMTDADLKTTETACRAAVASLQTGRGVLTPARNETPA